MRVKVKRIPYNERIKGTDRVKASSWDLDSEEITFVDDVYLDCSFININGNIEVKGIAFVRQDVRCSRCLEVVRKDKQFDFSFSYNKSDLGEFLDIDKDVREEMILNWPMKPLCSQQCRGICPDCGKNLNYEQCVCAKS